MFKGRYCFSMTKSKFFIELPVDNFAIILATLLIAKKAEEVEVTHSCAFNIKVTDFANSDAFCFCTFCT